MNVSGRTQFIQNFSYYLHTHPTAFRIAQLACASIGFVSTALASENKIVLQTSVGLISAAFCSQIPSLIKDRFSPQQEPPTEDTPLLATADLRQRADDSEAGQASKEQPDDAQGAADDEETGAFHLPASHRLIGAGAGAARDSDFDFSPCSSDSECELFSPLPQFRPEIFFTKGAVSPGAPPTPLSREYRVRAEREEILRRLATSLDRARIQMESLPPGPHFAFDIPPAEDFPALRIPVADRTAGVCSARGRRPTMEDAHIAATFNISIAGTDYPCLLFGIFDGHGGSEAARFVERHIQQVLRELIVATNRTNLTIHGMYNALKLLGVRLSEEFNQKAPLLRDVGTTLSIALIINELLWTATIGDSRIILDNAGTAEQLTEDQKPGDPYYTNHIITRGGSVRRALHWDGREIGPMRTNGMLATARAIGDASCLPAHSLSARAKVTFKRMDQILPESFLILACDGITDVANTQQIVDAIHANSARDPEDLARGLSHSAFRAGSTDNLSSMVLRLR